MNKKVLQQAQKICQAIQKLPLEECISALNAVREQLHQISPFKLEPVDCVRWVKADSVHANDYNPNSVAPPEMKLLEVSILEDGYTQPIVTFEENDSREVVDGFHRNRVGKESLSVKTRIHGYLPVVTINENRTEKADRIAATIRHNRARGKHKVEAMSDIVVELKRRNWTNERISRELGMEQDEILRLCQITGLAELFSDQEFSKSWDVEGEVTESDFKELTDDVATYGEEADDFRTVNTSDGSRIFHTYEKWECYKAGFYNTTIEGMTKPQAEESYRAFLSDTQRFEQALERVTGQWVHSCEHYLTNTSMDRIAWLGQAAACEAIKIPSSFRSGFNLLTEDEQYTANMTALKALNNWLSRNNRPMVMLGEAMGQNQSDIY